MQTLNDQEIEYLLEHGEFSPLIRYSTERVVVVMTQSWCSQWQDLQSYLPEFQSMATIYSVEYDLHPWFDRILAFKEDVAGKPRTFPIFALLSFWKSDIVCYNWLPKRSFATMLDRQIPFTIKMLSSASDSEISIVSSVN